MASGYIAMKADRAKLHLDRFNLLMSDWLKKANTVTTRDDVHNSRCIRRTEFHALLPEIGMELGEFLYCIRSGLDQLAWHLALPASRETSPKDIYFPIVEKVVNSNDRRNLRKTLDLFPSDVARR